eukprot:78613-Prymnesium_polylepis.1
MTLIGDRPPGDPSRRARSVAGATYGLRLAWAERSERHSISFSRSKNLTESVQVHASRLAPFACVLPAFRRMFRVPPR